MTDLRTRPLELTRRAVALASHPISALGRLPSPRRTAGSPAGGLGRGMAFAGTVWPGGDAAPIVDALAAVDGHGVLRFLGPADAAQLPADLPVVGGPGCWVGPALVDAHVRLALRHPPGPTGCLGGGLAAVRDLQAPLHSARGWRTGHRRPPAGSAEVAVSGPALSATSRGAAVLQVPSVAAARQAVHRLAAGGADLVVVSLDAGDGRGLPLAPAVLLAVVRAAHDAGLAVSALAEQAEYVARAVDAGVDELARVPAEPLGDDLVERIAEAGTGVVSTLQAWFSAGRGRVAAANAIALVRAGVQLRYGTGPVTPGAGRAGVDPRELDRLAECGLGRLGALRAATVAAAGAPGIRRATGRLRVGAPAALVLVPGNPLVEPEVWWAPAAVVADGRLVTG